MTIYEQAIAKWGKERQKIKVVEELIELVNAILHDDRENVLEESCDVGIMLHQLYEIYDIQQEEWDVMRAKKENKLKQALNEK